SPARMRKRSRRSLRFSAISSCRYVMRRGFQVMGRRYGRPESGEGYFIRCSNGETMCRGLDCVSIETTFENDPTCPLLNLWAFMGTVRLKPHISNSIVGRREAELS